MIKSVFKRLINFQRLPEQILILLTNPRSGSTWLFDALRCHPAIYMQSRSNIYEHLELTGRRYPRDLSETSSLKIEISPGKWERIPEFKIEKAQDYISEEVMRKPYAIEKIHPHFYKHDVNRFMRSIASLERTSKIQFIYQVRDPKSSMVSFLRYQHRNSSWNRHIRQDQLPIHMKRIYESLYKTAMEYPGLVIDYTELMTNFSKTMLRIIDYIWPKESITSYYEKQKIIDLMAEFTSRDKRRKGGTSFLGEKAGSLLGNDGKYDTFFQKNEEEIEKSYRPYNLLLALRVSQNERI